MDKKALQYKVAAASSDGIVINKHFGRADTFYIYEVSEMNEYTLVEVRKLQPVCSGGNHDDSRLCEKIDKLKDCEYILVGKIGEGAVLMAEQAGIMTMELPGMIEDAINKINTYRKIQNLF